MTPSAHLVDPELRPLLGLLPVIPHDAASLALARAQSYPMPPPGDDGVVLERRWIPGPAGAPDILVHIYRPARIDGAIGCILHMHGGGFVMGKAVNQELVHRRFVADLGCALVSVDYRLAPETVFPGAIEDCYVALGWVFNNCDALTIDPTRIGVMGESAGGGLAAALALLARDRGEFSLAFQHLIYPMLDDRTCVRDDPSPYAGEFIWTPQNNLFGWTSLLGSAPGGAGISCYAAPARVENLEGLPPTFIATGALDLFVEEDLDYALRLLRAGIPVELHVYLGAFHAFDLLPRGRLTETTYLDRIRSLHRSMAPTCSRV